MAAFVAVKLIFSSGFNESLGSKCFPEKLFGSAYLAVHCVQYRLRKSKVRWLSLSLVTGSDVHFGAQICFTLQLIFEGDILMSKLDFFNPFTGEFMVTVSDINGFFFLNKIYSKTGI